MPTLAIDNFGGRLTRYDNGDINSGYAKFNTTFGVDVFYQPGKINWLEQATRIDSGASVVTDLVMAGKERVESGTSYVYCVGHTGRVYKIQVNDPASFNPDYDNPILLATITAGSPTFTRGGSIDFFGSTERIYIGHDKGVTRIDFDGTNETAVSGTWTQTVPRPLKQFIGKLYVGNGSNIAEIDSTATVTSSTKLTPGFPTNSNVRDMDVSPDGNYLKILVSELALSDLTSITQDTNLLANANSYLFSWNGTDAGYTAFYTFPSFSMNAYHAFTNYEYSFGYDFAGGAVFNPTEKILTPALSQAPLPNAVTSNANIVAWGAGEYSQGFSVLCSYLYGPFDEEQGRGWWRQIRQSASSPETDVIRQPFAMLVSNFGIGASTNGYAGGVFGTAKVYFSTLEASSGPTVAYKLWKFHSISTGVGTSMSGIYETQNQLFPKKVKISEVRIYTTPLATNNSFTVALIGADNNVITNGSKVFVAGVSPVAVGQDLVQWNPQVAPTYALGIRIINLGSANWTCNKIEVDYEQSGK